MPHTPQHKRRESISRESRKALEAKGTKFAPEQRSQGTLDVEKGQKQVDFFKKQLAEGKFDDPVEESQLKEAIKKSGKDLEIDLAREKIGEQEEAKKPIPLTAKEQFDEDVKKGLILGAEIGLPIAASIVTGGLLGIGLGVGKVAGKVIAKKGTGVITKSIVRHQRDNVTGKLLARGTKVTQRAFTGKPSVPSGVNKIFGPKKLQILNRFASNPKSEAVTKSFMIKLGIGAAAVGIIYKALGTYPFAGFIKEEAIQTTGFAFNSAERNDDLVGMAEAIRTTEDILDSENEIREKIPYVNILNELDGYFGAVETKLETDKRTFAKKSREMKGGN